LARIAELILGEDYALFEPGVVEAAFEEVEERKRKAK
jgi:hypothetical protein